MGGNEPGTHLDQTQLRALLGQYFNLAEIESLCFDLGVNYEDLAGPELSKKINELIRYCCRHGLVDELITRCKELRPHVEWPHPWPCAEDLGTETSEKETRYGLAQTIPFIRRRRNFLWIFLIVLCSFFLAFYILVQLGQAILTPGVGKTDTLPRATPTGIMSYATPDETLLIISPFDRSYANKGFNAVDRIYSLISEKLPRSGTSLRVEKYPQVIGDQVEARKVLNTYGATLLIWGWYDDGGAQANVELDRDRIVSSKTDFTPATPESFHFKNVAAQASYLALFSLGMMQLGANNTAATGFFTGAIDCAQEVEDAANPWEALMWRGNIYAWGREFDLAVADYTKAINLHPHREAYFNRGVALGAQGKYDLAIADYNKAIELDPSYQLAYLNRGVIHGAQEKYDLAIADYSKAIELDPSDQSAYFNRGVIHGAQEKYDLAIADYNKGIDLNPNFAGGYTGRGNVYADWHKHKEAITDYKKAISLSPSPYTYCVLGITYTKIGDFASAVTALTQGVSLDKDKQYSWCKTALENAQRGTPTP